MVPASPKFMGDACHVAACGTVVLRERRGTFSSPQFPNDYPHRMACTWQITADAEDVVQLTVEAFTLEGPQGCPYDWVEIVDGSTRLGK